MPKVETVERINHSAQAMFDLVADVESYPQFVPLCKGLTVLSRRERQEREIIEARMRVGYKAIDETFISRVILNPDALQIDVSYIDGPFKHLDNNWTFIPVGPSTCDIDFRLDYAFKSRTLSLLMGSVFDRAFNRVVNAFRQRADAVYGVGAPTS